MLVFQHTLFEIYPKQKRNNYNLKFNITVQRKIWTYCDNSIKIYVNHKKNLMM
jgi:hypothetical protein